MKWCCRQPSLSVSFGKVVLFAFGLILTSTSISFGQQPDPIKGIEDATKQVGSYFSVAVYLMYAIGALAGIVGAIKAFGQWNSGDPHATKTTAAWFGSCLFLVVVATVLKTVFGIQ